jgi:hypothetical protein
MSYDTIKKTNPKGWVLKHVATICKTGTEREKRELGTPLKRWTIIYKSLCRNASREPTRDD